VTPQYWSASGQVFARLEGKNTTLPIDDACDLAELHAEQAKAYATVAMARVEAGQDATEPRQEAVRHLKLASEMNEALAGVRTWRAVA
jgi:hypothetical protein